MYPEMRTSWGNLSSDIVERAELELKERVQRSCKSSKISILSRGRGVWGFCSELGEQHHDFHLILDF
jgi:hypothetical protein